VVISFIIIITVIMDSRLRGNDREDARMTKRMGGVDLFFLFAIIFLI
jgi:hypothetical protein